MSLGFHEVRARRRRRARWNTVKWLLILSLIGGSSVYAYTSGSQFAEREVAELQLTVDRLTEEVGNLREERGRLRGRVTAIEAKLSEAERRHAANVLEGPLADLVSLTREQLDAGVEPDRLAFLVRAAAKAPSCDRQSTEKRILRRNTDRQRRQELRDLRGWHAHGFGQGFGRDRFQRQPGGLVRARPAGDAVFQGSRRGIV